MLAFSAIIRFSMKLIALNIFPGTPQSHYSYSKCGLGSHGTDRLVALVKHTKQKAQFDGASLFGAKITGGGCGGTVCVLGRAGVRSSDQIMKVRD